LLPSSSFAPPVSLVVGVGVGSVGVGSGVGVPVGVGSGVGVTVGVGVGRGGRVGRVGVGRGGRVGSAERVGLGSAVGPVLVGFAEGEGLHRRIELDGSSTELSPSAVRHDSRLPLT